MDDSFPGLATWQSVKRVKAGRITEVHPAGCFVTTEDPAYGIFLIYPDDKMTARYVPQVGDYWVIYDDGYQSISPRAPFESGYIVPTATV